MFNSSRGLSQSGHHYPRCVFIQHIDFIANILGVLAKKKKQYLLKENVFFVFRVSHPIAPLAVCLL